MAVEQHLHGFLLEFFGINATLGPVLLVGLHGTLLGCSVRVNLSSRSVHKTGYTSLCTLHEVHEMQRPMYSTGFHRSIAQVRWILLGTHFGTPESIRFHALKLNFTSLDDWMLDQAIVATEQLLEEGRFAGWRATCRLPTPDFISVPAIKGNLSFSYTTSVHHGFTSHRFDHEPYITLSFNEEHDLLACFWHVRQCQDFLTLFVGAPVSLKRFVASAGPNPDSNKVQIFYPLTISASRDPISRFDMLMRKSTIEPRLSELVPAWFGKWDGLRECVALFFGTLYNQGMYVESQFLGLCQAIEVYSRTGSDSRYLPEQDYEAVRQTLVAAIPPTVPKDLRRSLKDRLKWGNEFSLRKRITKLLAALEPPTVALICTDRDIFVKRLVNTRNYLTHYATDPRIDRWPDDDLFYGSQSLRILMTILLLKEIGLPEDAIRHALNQSHAASHLIGMYKARGLDRETLGSR